MHRLTAALAVASLFAGVAHAELTIVLDGKPTASVVIPKEASLAVRNASAELVRYVEEISGATLPVVPEGGRRDGVSIHVGSTARAMEYAPAEFGTSQECVLIRATARDLILCGGSDRGTAYAVYRFLEQVLGCRWLAHDEECVPRRATLTVGDVRILTSPVFDIRVFNGRREGLASWGLKLGLNGFFLPEDSEATGKCYYLWPGTHAYHVIMPNDPWFQKHPEWFPMMRGQRRAGALHGGQLCVTAEGLAGQFAANVIARFDQDPNLQIVSISPNDGYGWCECENCLALDKRLCKGRMTDQGLAGKRPFRGDRVFWFANEVGRRVAAKHPDKLLLCLAYVNYAEPPDSVKPLPNVIPWLCHYAPADYSRAIADPASGPNAQFNKLLLRWAESSPHLLFYSYVSKSMWWRLPRPVTTNFAADLKHLSALGIRRYYCQSTLTDWPEAGPLYYVLAKLQWDPSLDADAVAEDWVRHMFGPAAQAMGRFYDAVEQSVRQTGRPYSDNPPKHVPGLYATKELDRAEAALAEASAAATAEPYKRRVAKVGEVFTYGRHMIRCIELAHAFKSDPRKKTLEESIGEGRRALDYCAYRSARRYVDGLTMSADLGVLSQGFGGAEELGGRRCWNSDETGAGDGKSGWATIHIEAPDPAKPTRLEMDVWGTSGLDAIVINTGGQGKGYAAGGVWTPIKPEGRLSGKKQWDVMVYIIPPETYARGRVAQTIGLGGGDSQIWVASIRVKSVD